MTPIIKDVIEKINLEDDPGRRNQPLPDDSLIQKYEHETGFVFSADYKIFLKTVSNAFIGYLSPFTLSNDMKCEYGDLIYGLIEARKLGIPEDWLPICEDNGDYYCISPDGKVRFWDHNGATDEFWVDIASWANEVWLEGN